MTTPASRVYISASSQKPATQRERRFKPPFPCPPNVTAKKPEASPPSLVLLPPGRIEEKSGKSRDRRLRRAAVGRIVALWRNALGRRVALRYARWLARLGDQVEFRGIRLNFEVISTGERSLVRRRRRLC